MHTKPLICVPYFCILFASIFAGSNNYICERFFTNLGSKVDLHLGPVEDVAPCNYTSRRKAGFPIEDPETNRETRMFKMFDHFRIIIVMVNIMERIARKLRRIILLRFGLVTFRFHYWKTFKPLICMISGFSGVFLSPQTNYVYLWRHQDTLTNPNKPRIIFKI